jgi:hypothetical protein
MVREDALEGIGWRSKQAGRGVHASNQPYPTVTMRSRGGGHDPGATAPDRPGWPRVWDQKAAGGYSPRAPMDTRYAPGDPLIASLGLPHPVRPPQPHLACPPVFGPRRWAGPGARGPHPAPVLSRLAPRAWLGLWCGALVLASCGSEAPQSTTRQASSQGKASGTATQTGDAQASTEGLPKGGNPPGTPASAGAETWPEPNLELALSDLVRGFTPPDPAVTSDIRNAWQDRRRSLLESLRQAPDQLGQGLLDHLIAQPEEGALLRDGLLTGAAYAAPELAEPLLFESLREYQGGRLQADLGLRGRCAELLAEIAPARVEPLLAEILADGIAATTWPREEILLGAYIEACRRTGSDAVPVLATVATDIRMEAAARNAAIKELGLRCSPLAVQAIRTVLTESNGDRYLRRLAAQALVACLPAEAAATEIESVLGLEADSGMQIFLSSQLDALGAKLRAQAR